MIEGISIFLIIIGLIWVIFATFSDFRTREISNWLNFSLLIFALGARFFYSLFTENYGFLIQGILWVGIFFVLENLFYYGKMFAGGDAKLMLALGAIIPLYDNFYSNLGLVIDFFLIFFIVGAVYGVITGFYSASLNFSKVKNKFNESVKIWNKSLILSGIFGIIIILISFFMKIYLLTYLGIIILILPLLYLYAKAIDNTSLVKKINTKNLTEGDWLYQNVKVGKRIILANWNGVSASEIKAIRKAHKNILIREGIPFSPVFLISLGIFVWLFISKINLWNSLG